MSKKSGKEQRTVKFTVLYKSYLEQGKEFKPGFGIGVFASEQYTYALKPGEFDSPLFKMSLDDQKRVIMNDLFLVKCELVDPAPGEADPDVDAETPRSVMSKLFNRYRDICEAAIKSKAEPLDEAELSALISKCAVAIELLRALPLDKLGRMLGFVQGALAARGLISTHEEEADTEKMFLNAYKKMGYPFAS
jgi:hypothetical protein